MGLLLVLKMGEMLVDSCYHSFWMDTRLNDPAFDLDEQRLNPVHTVVYQSRPIWLPKIT